MSQYSELKGRLDAQKDTITAQEKRIDTLEERLKAKYNTLAEVPDWGREAVRDALDRGILSGVKEDELSLSWAEVRSLVLDYRREKAVR